MPKTSQEDILIVRNIDVACTEVHQELVRRDRSQQDENGHTFVAYEDVIDEWRHADFFQVRFNGYPHRIAPGEVKLMPRYLAEHYAKHLADHVLLKTGKPQNHAIERPKTLAKIIEGVHTYFQEDASDDNQRLAQRLDELNRPENVGVSADGKTYTLKEVTDAAPVASKALGVLDQPPEKSLDELLDEVREDDAPSQEVDPNRPRLDQPDAITRKELLEAAHSQGIKVTGRENKAELISKLKQFT